MKLAPVVGGLIAGALTSAPAVAAPIPAPEKEELPGSIIFARGASLYRADDAGLGPAEIATLPGDKPHIRSLRTDAAGNVLLADVDGSWAWMPLDGSAKTLSPLPCGDGPAQLEEDGSHVICRAKPSDAPAKALDVNLLTGKAWPIDVPAVRLVGAGAARRLVWAAADGIWSAPPSPHPQSRATKVAPEPPLRSFLPSPDGARALGVYASEIYIDAHHKQLAEVLMGFALDGVAARRKAIKSGVPLEWSHDAQWVLVQDGANACLMRATGGEYKCWPGYTAASISADGRYALVLGNRDGSKRQTPSASPKKRAAPPPAPAGADEAEGEGGDDASADDVAVPPPSGPLALYRVRLEGSAFTESPALVVRIVDGAAVWVPAP